MAENRPWLFDILSDLSLETELYTARKNNASQPKEYRFTLGQLISFINQQSQSGGTQLVTKIHTIATDTTTVTLDSSVPNDLANTQIYRSGVLQLEGIHFTNASGTLTFTDTVYSGETITAIVLQ